MQLFTEKASLIVLELDTAKAKIATPLVAIFCRVFIQLWGRLRDLFTTKQFHLEILSTLTRKS